MAAGDTLLVFYPGDVELYSTVAQTAVETLINQHMVLDFFDGETVDTVCNFSSILPSHYDSNGITVYIHYCTPATSGDTDWEVAFERIGDQQQAIDSDGFAAAQTSTGNTVPGTAYLVDVIDIPFTDGAQIDNIAVGEGFRVQLTRAYEGTLTDSAYVLMVELRETT